MVRADAGALRPKATYALISHRTRADSSSPEMKSSKAARVLAQVKTGSRGKFSTRFVVPLRWRHDHLIEVGK
ncbi:hypothetical protein KIH74_05395 [Kineosporia sp. J2-2]|uniref:Uncharacterized protein n=1 Tax=Kineosporia corallincola TaxID=2835133 RepID=A0ABS5TB97_9ACTN|nr:hypothetical protein [Kineosporia corallincola]MBT0768347.1 hypothetical protein [Kineosporia corallincola]